MEAVSAQFVVKQVALITHIQTTLLNERSRIFRYTVLTRRKVVSGRVN